ncbi:MAG: hypothetical protein VKI42_02245 [Synechococcaceae cyanobacterium]|nr:hypothetical protein [Synechococcaceae cyanobacterium]
MPTNGSYQVLLCPTARAFDLPTGFEPSAQEPSTLMVRLSDVRDALLP